MPTKKFRLAMMPMKVRTLTPEDSSLAMTSPLSRPAPTGPMKPPTSRFGE